MPQNISKGTKQSRLEALTYGAGAQFDSQPYSYATSKDLERELRTDKKHSGQLSFPTKAQRKSRDQQGQAQHRQDGVKKPKYGGHNSKETAPPDPFPRLQRKGDQDIDGTRSGA